METILQTVELVRGKRMRQEDVAQREYENTRRDLHDARRAVDKRTEQLKAISSLAALFAGFSMVVLVESNVDADVLPQLLMAAFGGVTAIAAGAMLLSMINASLILVAVLNFDCKRSVLESGQFSFVQFWSSRCERDFLFAFKCFGIGVPAFVISLALLGWVKFHQSTITAVVITVVAVTVLIIWAVHIGANWGQTAASNFAMFGTSTDVFYDLVHSSSAYDDMHDDNYHDDQLFSADQDHSPDVTYDTGKQQPRKRNKEHEQEQERKQQEHQAQVDVDERKDCDSAK